MAEKVSTKATIAERPSKPASHAVEPSDAQFAPGDAKSRIVSGSPAVSSGDILALQRRIGNHAVQGLLARRAERLSARNANGVSEDAEEAVELGASTSGPPLPEALRRSFEASLGADLSGVRVHNGRESAEAASAVGAKAYAVGQDIHFGTGYYAPTDPGGVHLLAHEVAHTVQSRGGTPQRQNKLEVSNPDDAAEIDADRAADAMVAGARWGVGDAADALHRQDNPPPPAPTGATSNPNAPGAPARHKPALLPTAGSGTTPPTYAAPPHPSNAGLAAPPPDSKTATVPAAKDPAVIKLVHDTREELDQLAPNYDVLMAPNAHPSSGGNSVNGHMIEDYKNLRDELEHYVASVADNPKGMPKYFLDEWREALYDESELRRVLESNIVNHYNGILIDEQKRLKEIKASLEAKNAKLQEYLGEVKVIEKRADAISFVLNVGDALEALEAASGNVEHFLEVEGVEALGKAAIGALVGGKTLFEIKTIRYQSNIIEGNVDFIKEKAIENAIQSTGYASLEDLAAAMQNDAENFRDSEANVRYLAQQKARAEGLYSQQSKGQARK